MTSPHSESSPRLGDAAVLNRRYVIQRKLGSGSFGSVYLALDRQAPKGQRPVALKILRPEHLTRGAIADLQEEFRTIATLHHRQIASAFDFGYVENTRVPFYTREYVRGTPLPAGPPGRSAPREFLRPLLDLLDALHYLHAHGILHLDIHAGNLIVAEDSERGAVLIDFGVVRSLGRARRSGSWYELSGLPPELVRGQEVTPATDLFLVGRLLLYRLSGRVSADVRLPSEIPGWGSRSTVELERIATKALEPSPERRFRSALELHEALSRAIGETTTSRASAKPAEVTTGRDAELDAVERSFLALNRGESSVLWLAGGAGMGKTHLIQQARLSAQLLGHQVTQCRFHSDPDPEPSLRRVLKSVPGAQRWLRPLNTEHGGTPEERAKRAASAYFAQKGAGLVLLLDDFGRADRESQLLAAALAHEVIEGDRDVEAHRSLCLVLTATSAPPAAFPLGKWRRQSVLRLKPLKHQDAMSLLHCATCDPLLGIASRP